MKEWSFKNDVLPLKDKLYRLALRITLNKEEAEDIVQDTLMKVWMRRNSLTTVKSIESFSMTICHNLSVDRAQKADRKTLSIDETLHDNEAGNAYLPDQQLISRDRRQTMMKILATLPEKQRTAIQLRDMEGMEYKEIAKIMGITESDVKVTLFRGRNKLKEEYLKISQYGL